MDEKTRSTKSFWRRPEGVTGMVFIAVLSIAAVLAIYSNWAFIMAATQSVVSLTIILLVLSVIAFLIFDPTMRNLISFMYKSIMRKLTGYFVTIDPIKVLRNYVQELSENLKKMNRQMHKLREQMHLLKEQILQNNQEIQNNLTQASEAKERNQRKKMILQSRRAGRLKESNIKLDDLLKRMEILYKVLTRMYDNSYILKEDIEDQVNIKEKERQAIHASHSAMSSAMNIINGNKDKRFMFDQALEAIADDVSQKVGEMEQFMEMSESFMSSIDLENGIYEEEGLEMLRQWESEEDSLLLGEDKSHLLLEKGEDDQVLDLNQPIRKAEKVKHSSNQYDSFFDFEEEEKE